LIDCLIGQLKEHPASENPVRTFWGV